MVFSDLFFIYIFIPLTAISYAIARHCDLKALRAARRHTAGRDPKDAAHRPVRRRGENSAENVVLVIFSLFFYAWGEPIYVFLMIISVIINYFVGRFIRLDKTPSKTALIIGIVINISIIGVFKYTDFLIGTLNAVGIGIPQPHIRLPIGISFFTFQSMSYLIDVYRGDAPPQKSLMNLMLYISMFPQLIAGPIVRYDTIAREINSRDISLNDLSEGSFRFLIGLGKKVILANQLSEITDLLMGENEKLAELTTGGAWIGLIAFSLQIYFDFSGYSDMAIGMGRCMGFHFDENFNYPYICDSITDFWRRWHISLGSFFRDYVYIPMGGNRRHQPLNIMTVWFLTGLWHGASWNFVLWGVYFGVIIMLEKYTILKIKDKIPAVIRHIYCLILITLGWGLFYFTDFGRLGQFFACLFGGGAGGWDLIAQNTFTGNIWLLLVSMIGCLPIGRFVRSFYVEAPVKRGKFFAAAITLGKTAAAAAILITSTLLLIGATNNAFLYSNF